MDSVIGTCSICGGAVTVPKFWGGTLPPVPACRSCGATQKNPHGPVIDMEPARKAQKQFTPSEWLNCHVGPYRQNI